MSTIYLQPKSSTSLACGFAVMSALASGCVPEYAEELTADERQEFEAGLLFAHDRLDLAREILTRANPGLVFVSDADVTSPTADDVGSYAKAQVDHLAELCYKE